MNTYVRSFEFDIEHFDFHDDAAIMDFSSFNFITKT